MYCGSRRRYSEWSGACTCVSARRSPKGRRRRTRVLLASRMAQVVTGFGGAVF